MRLPILLRSTAAVAALALSATACASDATNALGLMTDGTLTLCTDAPYEPFEFEDAEAPSGYSGFDIDIVQAIADANELELSIVNSGFDPLLSGSVFAANTCDMGIAATTITAERDEKINFSDVYYSAIQSLAVPADSSAADLASLAGMKIGVQSGTTGESYATDNAPADTTIVSFDNPGDVFLALIAGEVDAILQDEPVNATREAATGDVKIVETFDTGEDYGMLFPEEGAEDLITLINEGLQVLRDSGEYQTIFDGYFS
jgi:polar amino acid transport system substrate-binding protein